MPENPEELMWKYRNVLKLETECIKSWVLKTQCIRQ